MNTDSVRIADSDREQAISQLSKHAGDGRLTLEEFETRASEVYAAKTYADLRPVFRDLPSHDGMRPVRGERSYRRPHVHVERLVFPLVMLTLLVVATASLGGWVLLIVGFWILVPRLTWARSRRMHHRHHARTSDHLRDEELTTV